MTAPADETVSAGAALSVDLLKETARAHPPPAPPDRPAPPAASRAPLPPASRPAARPLELVMADQDEDLVDVDLYDDGSFPDFGCPDIAMAA